MARREDASHAAEKTFAVCEEDGFVVVEEDVRSEDVHSEDAHSGDAHRSWSLCITRPTAGAPGAARVHPLWAPLVCSAVSRDKAVPSGGMTPSQAARIHGNPRNILLGVAATIIACNALGLLLLLRISALPAQASLLVVHHGQGLLVLHDRTCKALTSTASSCTQLAAALTSSTAVTAMTSSTAVIALTSSTAVTAIPPRALSTLPLAAMDVVVVEEPQRGLATISLATKCPAAIVPSQRQLLVRPLSHTCLATCDQTGRHLQAFEATTTALSTILIGHGMTLLAAAAPLPSTTASGAACSFFALRRNPPCSTPIHCALRLAAGA